MTNFKVTTNENEYVRVLSDSFEENMNKVSLFDNYAGCEAKFAASDSELKQIKKNLDLTLNSTGIDSVPNHSEEQKQNIFVVTTEDGTRVDTCFRNDLLNSDVGAYLLRIMFADGETFRALSMTKNEMTELSSKLSF